jgi:hypothetical protein
MDSNAYKKKKVNELVSLFNQNVAKMKTTLNNQINSILRLRLRPIVKQNYINFYISNYNKSLVELRKKLTNDINNINSLSFPVQETQKQNKTALLFGINYEGTEHQLYGCINDTTNMREALEQFYNYNQFTVLTDKTNKKPTKENIISEFTNLLKNAAPGDNLLFFYSGHGTNDYDLSGDERDEQDELIVPLGANTLYDCIRDDDLNKIIKDYLKPGVSLSTLFDCCFSGTILDLKYNYIDTTNFEKTTINELVSETTGNVWMISGCQDNQTSADATVVYNNRQMNAGAMTYSFLKCLKEQGTNISYKQLMTNMRETLKKENYTQVPQLSSGKQLNVEDIINI